MSSALRAIRTPAVIHKPSVFPQLGRPLRDAAAALALFLLGPAIYHRALTPGWTIGDGDYLFYFLPYRSYLAEAWHQGRWLPLWNPHIYLGAPFMANIQASVLYPPNLLLLAMSPTLAIGWLVALHAGFGGAGMYLFACRALRLGRAGGLVAGLVYMLSTLMFSQVGHVNQENTLGLTPWLMLAADRAAVAPKPQRLALLAASLALVVLAGHTQQAYLSLLLAGGVAVARLWGMAIRRRLWKRAARTALLLAGATVLGVGLTAVQVVATVELIGQSARSGGLSLTEAGSFSLPFHGFLGSFLPDYTADHPAEFSASVGAAALPLICLAIWTRWRRPRVWMFALLGVSALVVAFGPKARIYDLFYALLPGFDLFRVPARLLLFTTIAAAVLAGEGVRASVQLGLAWRVRRWRPRVRSAVWGALGLAALPVAAASVALLAGGRTRGPLLILPLGQRENVALTLGFETAVLALIMFGLFWRRLAPALLPLVTLVDLVLLSGHAYALNPLPEGVAQASVTTAALVPHGPNERYLALMPAGGASRALSAIPTGLPQIDSSRYDGLSRIGESLAPDVSMLDGILDADGYDGGVLPTRDYVEFRAALLSPGANNPPDYTDRLLTDRVSDPHWLRQAAVTTVLTDGRDPNAPGSRALVPVRRAGSIIYWQLAEPLTRAHLKEGQPAQITSDTGERVVVRLSAGAADKLVLADAYYPGWTASVDGRPVGIDRYSGYERAVSLTPGVHEVVFEYRPRWLAPTAAVSVASLGVVLGLVVAPILLRRGRTKPDDPRRVAV